MSRLQCEAREHVEEKRKRARLAARMVAFFLATGIDLKVALAGGRDDIERAIARVSRLLERERLRGAARHWTYDLNRHIALGEALQELRRAAGWPEAPKRLPRHRRKKKAAPEGAATIRSVTTGRTD